MKSGIIALTNGNDYADFNNYNYARDYRFSICPILLLDESLQNGRQEEEYDEGNNQEDETDDHANEPRHQKETFPLQTRIFC